MNTASIILVAGAVLLAASRVLTKARPLWGIFPQVVQDALPAAIVGASALGELATGAIGPEQAAYLLITAAALYAPGKLLKGNT